MVILKKKASLAKDSYQIIQCAIELLHWRTLMEPNTAIVTFLESKSGLFRAQYNKATLGMASRTSTVLLFPSKMKPVKFLANNLSDFST